MRPSAITVPSIFTLLARSSDPQPPKRSPPISPVRAYTRKQRGRCKMINTPNTGCPVFGVFTTKIFRFVAFSGPFSAYKNRKTHDLHRIFNGQSWVFFGALEGTRIPGPLIKSQMLYRLSYERIFCGKTIPPNNITTIGCKKQERHLKKRKFQFYTTKLLKKPLRPALQQLHQQAGIDADHRGRLAQIHGLALGQVG